MFDEIVTELLAQTDASRTTLRLDRPDEVFPVVAEARAPGIRSIADATEIDLRRAPTVLHLMQERSVLVQGDLETAKPRPPRELIEIYGARAQMLAPVMRDDALAGILSVHECRGPREWTTADVDNLRAALQAVQSELAAGHG